MATKSLNPRTPSVERVNNPPVLQQDLLTQAPPPAVVDSGTMTIRDYEEAQRVHAPDRSRFYAAQPPLRDTAEILNDSPTHVGTQQYSHGLTPLARRVKERLHRQNAPVQPGQDCLTTNEGRIREHIDHPTSGPHTHNSQGVEVDFIARAQENLAARRAAAAAGEEGKGMLGQILRFARTGFSR